MVVVSSSKRTLCGGLFWLSKDRCVLVVLSSKRALCGGRFVVLSKKALCSGRFVVQQKRCVAVVLLSKKRLLFCRLKEVLCGHHFVFQRIVVWLSFGRPRKVVWVVLSSNGRCVVGRLVVQKKLCGLFCRPTEGVWWVVLVQETVVSSVVLLSKGAFCGRRVIV